MSEVFLLLSFSLDDHFNIGRWISLRTPRCYKPGVLNLLVSAYPKIKIVSLCVPPNQNYMPFAYPQIKNYTQKGFFWVFFLNFAYPLWSSHVPLGVREPQVKNRCYKQYWETLYRNENKPFQIIKVHLVRSSQFKMFEGLCIFSLIKVVITVFKDVTIEFNSSNF
jgi:hypothetical protein